MGKIGMKLSRDVEVGGPDSARCYLEGRTIAIADALCGRQRGEDPAGG